MHQIGHIILIILLICILTYNYPIINMENFSDYQCKNLYKPDGITCSLTSSPLFPAKCYKVGIDKKNHPFGWVRKLDSYDENCRFYPNCEEVGSKCNSLPIYTLGGGYVELL